MKPACKQCMVFGCGLALAVVAGVLALLWPTICTAIVKNELTLSSTSRAFGMWKETPIPMYFKVYMFNMTNYKSFLADKRVKPILVQLGPYVFREKHFKVDLVWNSNDTITFHQNRTWQFQPELSNGTLDDKITNINAITATVGFMVRREFLLIKKAVNWLLEEKHEALITTRTVRELLFDGYEDEMLKLIRDLNISSINLPFDKFGWFSDRNGSALFDGLFNMHTGKSDMNKVGIMDRWNKRTNTKFYGPPCNMVNGTLGDLWPPMNGKKNASIFVPDFCCSIQLGYEKKYERFGLEGVQFSGNERLFDNGSMYPEMGCFSSLGQRVASGVMNVSACRYGAPVFVSYPHFYLADESYRNAVIGMEPNASLHGFSVAMEPNTGIPLFVNAQLQINLMIQPYSGIKCFDGLKRMFIPMIWFSQTATLTEDLAQEAKVVLLLPTVGNYTFIGIGAIGLLVLFIGLMITLNNGWRGHEGAILLEPNVR